MERLVIVVLSLMLPSSVGLSSTFSQSLPLTGPKAHSTLVGTRQLWQDTALGQSHKEREINGVENDAWQSSIGSDAAIAALEVARSVPAWPIMLACRGRFNSNESGVVGSSGGALGAVGGAQSTGGASAAIGGVTSIVETTATGVTIAAGGATSTSATSTGGSIATGGATSITDSLSNRFRCFAGNVADDVKVQAIAAGGNYLRAEEDG